MSFSENDHPRREDGKFGPKAHAPVDVDLSDNPDVNPDVESVLEADRPVIAELARHGSVDVAQAWATYINQRNWEFDVKRRIAAAEADPENRDEALLSNLYAECDVAVESTTDAGQNYHYENVIHQRKMAGIQ